MKRALIAAVLLLFALPLFADDDPSEAILRQAFLGKQITLKVDMPGTQKGVDLHFDRSNPMDWDDYSNRLRQYGPALHKGDRATVTSVVVKKDRIEFQLDGGGFGTAHDDASTTVSPRTVPKSERQERLEKQLKDEKDPDRRRDLKRDIDREQARRDALQSRENAAAQVASQIKAQEVAARRLQGGSRFNLRWKDQVPAPDLLPDAVRARLAEYVDFTAAPLQPQPAVEPAVYEAGGPAPPLPIYKGMKWDEAQRLLGSGQLISQQQNDSGQLIQDIVYATEEWRARVTFVNGIVTRYVIESR